MQHRLAFPGQMFKNFAHFAFEMKPVVYDLRLLHQRNVARAGLVQVGVYARPIRPATATRSPPITAARSASIVVVTAFNG